MTTSTGKRAAVPRNNGGYDPVLSPARIAKAYNKLSQVPRPIFVCEVSSGVEIRDTISPKSQAHHELVGSFCSGISLEDFTNEVMFVAERLAA